MPRRPSNATGLERTLKALGAAGRLTDVDQALVALARGLAAAVDGDPENAALWREYRAALASLSTIGTEQVDDDTLTFLHSVRTPLRPAVGDAKKS